MERVEDFYPFMDKTKYPTKEDSIQAYLKHLSEKYEGQEYCANCKFLKFEWNSNYHICRRFPHFESAFLDGWCGEWKKR
jgi:hypothetical protein